MRQAFLCQCSSSNWITSLKHWKTANLIPYILSFFQMAPLALTIGGNSVEICYWKPIVCSLRTLFLITNTILSLGLRWKNCECRITTDLDTNEKILHYTSCSLNSNHTRITPSFVTYFKFKSAIYIFVLIWVEDQICINTELGLLFWNKTLVIVLLCGDFWPYLFSMLNVSSGSLTKS